MTSKDGLVIHNLEYKHLEVYGDDETIIGPMRVIVKCNINYLEIKVEFKVDEYLDVQEIKSLILEKMKGSIQVLEDMGFIGCI